VRTSDLSEAEREELMVEYVAANQNNRHFIKQVLWSWEVGGEEEAEGHPQP